MKTKPKNFGNFFVRVGAGFLAFWLLSMGAFSLLLGQQRAELMAADIKDSADWYTGDYARYMLDSKEHEENDPAELRRMLKEQSYRRNSSDALMIVTAITDQGGNILQSDRWWLILTDDTDIDHMTDKEYLVDMSDQPQNVLEAIYIGSGVVDQESLPYDMRFEAWVDGDEAYLKSVTVRPYEEVNGELKLTDEVNTVECAYDADKMSDLPLKKLVLHRMSFPGHPGVSLTAKQVAADMTSPKRKEMRAWVENPSEAGSAAPVVRPWLVRQYQRTMKYCDYVDGGYVMMSFAAEGCPLKACLPILVPAGVLSLILAILCAIILSCALLRVWRKQERVERVRRETTARARTRAETPLSVLSATAELLGDNLAPEKQAYYLGVIRQQAQRMDGSVRQMLELSRLETGAKALPANGVLSGRIGAGAPAGGSADRFHHPHRICSTGRIRGQCGQDAAHAGTGRTARERRAAHAGGRLHYGAPRGRCALGDEHRRRHSGGRAAAAVGGVLSGRSVAQRKRRRTGTVDREDCVRSAWLCLRSGEYRNRTEVLVPICR